MPRAFLIKAKKDKKKEEELGTQFPQDSAQFSNGVSDLHFHGNESAPLTEFVDQISTPVETQTSLVSLPAKRKHSQSAADEKREICSAPTERPNEASGLDKENSTLEISHTSAKLQRKTRKRSPKKTAVYYYNAQEGKEPHREVNKEKSSFKDVPLDRQVPPNKAISTLQQNSHNYAAADSKRVKSQGNPNGGYYYDQTAHSMNCQEKTTRFEYEKGIRQEHSTQYNYAKSHPTFPREERDVAQNTSNVGLDNVKIVEVHSIGQTMEAAYPDKNRNGPAPPRHPSEDFNRHTTANHVPTSTPASQYEPRPQEKSSVPTPVPASAAPVVHYLPVYAIPSSSGVQYQAVPGAAILEKVPGSSNLYSPVGRNGEPKAKPEYQQQPPTAPQQPPPQPQVPPAMPPQPQVQVPPHSHVPVSQHQGPVAYQPRMISNPSAHPQPHPAAQASYPPQPSNPPRAALPYPPPDPRIMPSQAYQPQTTVQPVSAPPYVVTKSEPVPQQQHSPAGHPVVTSQPYPVPVQAAAAPPPPPPQQYPPPNQVVAGQPPYPAQDQKMSRPPMYPPHYQPIPNQHPYQIHVVPVAMPYPPPGQQVSASQPAQPVQTVPVPSAPHQYSNERPPPVPPQHYYPPHSGGTVHYQQPENSPQVPVHYYPTNQPAGGVVQQQYPERKPAVLPALPYPAENTSQPPTPQYTPDGKDQQKFVYATPPPDFLRSPVYRVPVTEAPPMVQTSQPPVQQPIQPAVQPMAQPLTRHSTQPPKGAKRRKTAMPHREITEMVPSPESSYPRHSNGAGAHMQYTEQISKSPNQNPALNKSSCVITPPGSPQDHADGSYTVVMRDYGVQAGPPPEQDTWTVKVESAAPRVYISEEEALAHGYEKNMSDEEEEEEDDEEDEEYCEADGEHAYSPTQKENLSPGNFVAVDENGNPIPSKGKKRSAKYTCKFCGKAFQWHSHLSSHERTHTGEKPFKCPECARAFTRADGLQCHMLVHNKKKPFKCHYCNKGFNDNTSLEKHTYSHTGVKPFKCEYCGRAFSDSQSIEKHLLVHTGTKPYKCQFCVRSFNDSQMLVRHIRSHTGEKPFKCQHCQMAFSKQSALVIHTRVHTGEKPYQCSHCSKCFSISGNLQRHILIHTGERPYKCSKCPKAFNNPSHLSRHISKLHAPQVKSDGSAEAQPNFAIQESNASDPMQA